MISLKQNKKNNNNIEIPPIIIEFGSFNTRLGYAGEDKPRNILLTVF